MKKIKIFSLFFLLFFVFAKNVFADEPIIENIYSYQPESDLLVLQTSVTGKNLTDLELSIDQCTYPDSKQYNDTALFGCTFSSEASSGTYKAQLKKNEIIVQEFFVNYRTKDEIGKSYLQGKEPRIILASADLQEKGMVNLYFYGYNIPSDVAFDIECEDDMVFLSQVPYPHSGERFDFRCHKTRFRYQPTSEIFSFLVKKNSQGEVLFHALQPNQSTFRYVKTVHINPFSTDGHLFYEIYVLGNFYEWDNFITIQADFCKKIAYFPDYFIDRPYDGPGGGSFYCEPNGKPPNIQNVEIRFKLTNTLLWPVDPKQKGYIMFPKNQNWYEVKDADIRSWQLPDLPYITYQTDRDEKIMITLESSSDKDPNFILTSSFCANLEHKTKIVGDKNEYWKGYAYYNTVFTCIVDQSKKTDKAWIKVIDGNNGQLIYQNFPFNQHDTVAESFFLRIPLNGYWIGISGKNFQPGLRLFSRHCEQIDQLIYGFGANYNEFNCIPKTIEKVQISDFILFDETEQKVYWPIDISKGFSEPLDQFIKRTGVEIPLQDQMNKKTLLKEKRNERLKKEKSKKEQVKKELSKKEKIQKESLQKEAVTIFSKPTITKIDFSFDSQNFSLLKIRIFGQSLPDSLVVYIPECADMVSIYSPLSSDQFKEFHCLFSPWAYSGIRNGLVKTKKGGEVISEFSIDYKAPSAYRVEWIYPSVHENYTITKNNQVESFVYFQVEDYHGLQNEFEVTLDVAGKTVLLSSKDSQSITEINWKTFTYAYLGSGQFILKIPMELTKGIVTLKDINSLHSFLGGPFTISIDSSEVIIPQFKFTQDWAMGVNAQLSPLISVGGEYKKGGDLSFDMNSVQTNTDKIPLLVGYQFGGGLEGGVGRDIGIITLKGKLKGNVDYKQKFSFDYRNVEDYAGEENYKVYQQGIQEYLKVLADYDEANKCDNSFFKNLFDTDCEELLKQISKLSDQKKPFEENLMQIKVSIIKDEETLTKTAALLRILENGFDISKDKKLKDILSRLQISKTTLDAEEENARREAGFFGEGKVIADLGIKNSIVKANISAEAKEGMGSKMLYQHPEKFNAVLTETQSGEIESSLSGQFVQKALQKKISKIGFNKLMGKILTRLKSVFPKNTLISEGNVCKFLKRLLTKKGAFSDIASDYSNDCKGLSEILSAGFDIDISFGEGDVQGAFKNVFGFDLNDSLVALIAALLTGSDIDVLGILIDYPLNTSTKKDLYYQDEILKKVVFTTTFKKPGLAEDQIFADEYIFTARNGKQLPEPPSNFLLFNELEDYLAGKNNSELEFSLLRYIIIPEIESEIEWSFGWGASVKSTDKIGHEIKIPFEKIVSLEDGSSVKIFQIEESMMKKITEQMKILATKDSPNNAHMKTILDNLYQIVFFAAHRYSELGKPIKSVPKNLNY